MTVSPSTWPRPRGLLLDAMGTLIGLRRSVGHTYAAMAAEHGLSVAADAIDQAFPGILRQAPALAFPGLDSDSLLQAERHWWGERIDAVLVAAGAAVAPAALHDALFDRFADPTLWHVYADVPTVLRRWHGAGLRLAVVSNFDRRLQPLLEGLGLADLFEAVVVSSSAGAAKPSPVPFQAALESLALTPSQVWHVGDSPEDGAGARAAGVRCLLVRRP
ncbi:MULTISPECIES: HAD-IA family hydrolase [unclassified Cyanobium]|uniref:HAD-IA family hydrolase n=1 Tax=unclassified Cyanobium TaxID=2627006 RepID=UPI0020CC5B9E|nr:MULTISPECIES: HAD-IA family hydrolase [unclassified Cyanobium]MCP9860472.1 HAD-IA family hydrolase [Cyanobium sp. Cruz-8H5]MCP9867742.1 HAD-IA family hydrolase [Cyanobium sp. Cruz-8D1]